MTGMQTMEESKVSVDCIDTNDLQGILMDAVERCDKTLCHFLIESAGADVNAMHEGETPLRLAVVSGYIEIIEYLISKGAKVSIEDDHGIIFDAVQNGNMVICELLISAGADVNAVRDGDTPLRVAVRSGHLEIAEYLLSKGAQVNSKDNHSLLMDAVQSGKREICELLESAGADVDMISGNETLLHAAVQWGHLGSVDGLEQLGIIEYLISKGAAASNEDSQSILILAAKGGNKALCEFAISAGAGVNMKDGFYGTPLRAAAHHGDLAVIEYLLSQGAEVSMTDDHRGVLNYAASSGNKELCELLLSAGADINASDEFYGTPLRAAVKCGYLEMAQYLVSKGADVATCEDNEGILIDAVRSGNKELCEFLLSNGANINGSKEEHTFSEGSFVVKHETPLQAAADEGHLEIAEFLISKGALEGERNQGILIDAVESGNQALCEFLVTAGVDVNESVDVPPLGISADPQIMTPLRIAVRNGHLEIAQYLISKGAQLLHSEQNQGILIDAVESGNKSLCEFLVAAGVDVNESIERTFVFGGSCTYVYDTPIRAAALRGNIEIAAYLISVGAKVDCEENEGIMVSAVKGEGTVALCELLVSAGADVDAAYNGEVSLSVALDDKNLEYIEYLVSQGADISTEDRQRILVLAAKGGKKALCESLLSTGMGVGVGALGVVGVAGESVNKNSNSNVSESGQPHPSPPVGIADKKGYAEIAEYLMWQDNDNEL